MIPKTCFLTDKGKLEVTLKNHCSLTSFSCQNCPYVRDWHLSMDSWINRYRLRKKGRIIKIE